MPHKKARTIVDQYAREDPADGDLGDVTREQAAPAVFSALRAVLNLHKPHRIQTGDQQ